MTHQMDRYTPVFAITQAAELSDMHPQTLRQYDRIGLVSPQRTSGNTLSLIHISEPTRPY